MFRVRAKVRVKRGVVTIALIIFFTLQVLRPSHSIPSIKKKRTIPLRHLVLY